MAVVIAVCRNPTSRALYGRTLKTGKAEKAMKAMWMQAYARLRIVMMARSSIASPCDVVRKVQSGARLAYHAAAAHITGLNCPFPRFTVFWW